MSLKKSLNKIVKKKGFQQFLFRVAIFVVLLAVFSFFGINYTKEIGITNQASAFLNYNIGISQPIECIKTGSNCIFSLLTILIFVLITRSRFWNIKTFAFKTKEAITGSLMFVIAFILLVLFRLYLQSNTELISAFYWPLLIVKYLLPILMVIGLAIAAFGAELIKYFFMQFKLELLVSVLSAYFYLSIYGLLREYWQIFAESAIKILILIMPLLGFHAAGNANNLTVNNITLNIGQPCSGIESMSLFLFLYAVIIFIDWKEIKNWKALVLLPIGVVGMYLTNVLRIGMLFAVGARWGVQFAVGAFHSNIGWILFVLYFVGFQYITYNWIRK